MRVRDVANEQRRKIASVARRIVEGRIYGPKKNNITAATIRIKEVIATRYYIFQSTGDVEETRARRSDESGPKTELKTIWLTTTTVDIEKKIENNLMELIDETNSSAAIDESKYVCCVIMDVDAL